MEWTLHSSTYQHPLWSEHNTMRSTVTICTHLGCLSNHILTKAAWLYIRMYIPLQFVHTWAAFQTTYLLRQLDCTYVCTYHYNLYTLGVPFNLRTYLLRQLDCTYVCTYIHAYLYSVVMHTYAYIGYIMELQWNLYQRPPVPSNHYWTTHCTFSTTLWHVYMNTTCTETTLFWSLG